MITSIRANITGIVYVSNGCNMGTGDLPDMYARGLGAYISGKSQEHMLQVICLTSDCGIWI